MADDVLRRLQRLEDQEAIRAVIAAYADAVDHNGDPKLLKACFTPDAVWTSKGIGTWKGRAAVVKGLRHTCTVTIPWALHYMTQPVIRLAANGRTATAHYYLWELAKFRPKPRAEPESTWIGGWYDSSFRKEADGEWRFSRIVLHLKLASPNRLDEWETRK
jgi:uncharacterized protein (TIGR02246 family)